MTHLHEQPFEPVEAGWPLSSAGHGGLAERDTATMWLCTLKLELLGYWQ